MTARRPTHLALALALALGLAAAGAHAQQTPSPLRPAGQLAARPPAGDPRDAQLIQLFDALPPSVRARLRALPGAPGASPLPAWLTYGAESAPGFCGYNERGRAVFVVVLAPASRQSTARAIERIARTRGLSGNELVAELTREEVLRVAAVPGVVTVHPDGCSYINNGAGPGISPEQ